MANNCKECGCNCKKCILLNQDDVHLHVEIENLKQKLLERENHIVSMETNFLNEANKFPNGEFVALRDELQAWQDKYRRLYDAHRRVQRVNQGLEDKLLKLVDASETDKNTLTRDVAVLSQKLAEANYTIKKLNSDNERYKNDVSLAIQFLQCKKSNFVAQKFDTLPSEVQSQISNFTQNKTKPVTPRISYERKSIKVPIPTFPPTAMVYSVPKSPNSEIVDESTDSVDIVSAAIMAKVLEERQKDRAFAKHCDTCQCSKRLNIVYEITHHTIGTQTGDYKPNLCIKCNDVAHDAPQRLILVKNPEEIAQTVVKVQPNNFLLNDTISVVSYYSTNELALKASKMKHHKLCNHESVNKIARSTNALLENAQKNTIAPIIVQKATESEVTSLQSKSSDLKNQSAGSENSTQNQRVADWIQSNLDVEVSSSDNSQMSLPPKQYAIMEENVKRFLFGESEFLKTVELGKKKYKNYNEGDVLVEIEPSRSNSHTETKI